MKDDFTITFNISLLERTGNADLASKVQLLALETSFAKDQDGKLFPSYEIKGEPF